MLSKKKRAPCETKIKFFYCPMEFWLLHLNMDRVYNCPPQNKFYRIMGAGGNTSDICNYFLYS